MAQFGFTQNLGEINTRISQVQWQPGCSGVRGAEGGTGAGAAAFGAAPVRTRSVVPARRWPWSVPGVCQLCPWGLCFALQGDRVTKKVFVWLENCVQFCCSEDPHKSSPAQSKLGRAARRTGAGSLWPRGAAWAWPLCSWTARARRALWSWQNHWGISVVGYKQRVRFAKDTYWVLLLHFSSSVCKFGTLS